MYMMRGVPAYIDRVGCQPALKVLGYLRDSQLLILGTSLGPVHRHWPSARSLAGLACRQPCAEWTSLEPALEQGGHLDDERRFKDIVADLDGAQRPADFVAPTRATIAEAEQIERLFR